jgi:hypothetical protein
MPMTEGKVEHLAFTYAIKSDDDESPDSRLVAKFENELNTRYHVFTLLTIACLVRRYLYWSRNVRYRDKGTISKAPVMFLQQGLQQQSAVFCDN